MEEVGEVDRWRVHVQRVSLRGKGETWKPESEADAAGAEDHCGACDVLALASNYAFDGLVGRVHFEFLERIGDDRGVREHRLRSPLD